MRNCKLSKFNYIHEYIENGNKVFLVFNTLTRKLISVKNDEMLSEIKTGNINNNQKDLLMKSGILVDENEDEIEYMKYWYTNKVFSNKLLSVTILPTNDCDFRCVYCYQAEKTNYMGAEVMNNILSYLNKNIRYYETFSISWFGGEPLLSKKMICEMMKEIKTICRESKTPYVGSITTNGYELDIETFKCFVKNGLRYFQITIDGPEEVHNLQRPHKKGFNTYKRIVSNLKTIKMLPKNFRFEIGIRINVSKQNLNYMDELIEILSFFRDDKRFCLVWQWVRDWGGDRIGQNREKLLCNDFLCKSLIEKSKAKGIRYKELLSCSSGLDSCEAIYKNGYVFDYNGNIFKCTMKTQDITDIEKNCIGYLGNNGKLNIDDKKQSIWLKNEDIKEICKRCNLLPMCFSNSCPFSKKVLNKHKCLEFKNLIPYQIETMYEENNYIRLDI